MRKLNRLIAAGALAVPMALGASGIATAAVDSSGPLGLGQDRQEGDGSSDESASEGDAARDEGSAARDEGSATRDEGDDARDSGKELRDELLQIGEDLREDLNDQNSNDENSNDENSDESSSEDGSDLDLLGMGGANSKDNAGGLLSSLS